MLKNIVYLPYKMPGTQEFADVFTPGLKAGKDVFILRNHGVTVIAESIKSAYEKLETLENACKIVLMLKMAHSNVNEIGKKDVSAFFDNLGIQQ